MKCIRDPRRHPNRPLSARLREELQGEDFLLLDGDEGDVFSSLSDDFVLVGEGREVNGTIAGACIG